MSLAAYGQNVLNAVLGKKPEDKAEPFTTNGMSANLVISGSVITLILLFAVAYGAARLSYCYNIHVGNGAMAATAWSILAFFFNAIYYPFYGLFLNPLCAEGMRNVAKGGKRF
jgi:hypothetical protein